MKLEKHKKEDLLSNHKEVLNFLKSEENENSLLNFLPCYISYYVRRVYENHNSRITVDTNKNYAVLTPTNDGYSLIKRKIKQGVKIEYKFFNENPIVLNRLTSIRGMTCTNLEIIKMLYSNV